MGTQVAREFFEKQGTCRSSGHLPSCWCLLARVVVAVRAGWLFAVVEEVVANSDPSS